MPAQPGMPEYGGFGDRFKRIESQIDKLNRMTRLESASIGSGGLTVKDAGQIRILDASGNVQVTLDIDGLKVDGGSVLATVPAGNIEATGRSAPLPPAGCSATVPPSPGPRSMTCSPPSEPLSARGMDPLRSTFPI